MMYVVSAANAALVPCMLQVAHAAAIKGLSPSMGPLFSGLARACLADTQ